MLLETATAAALGDRVLFERAAAGDAAAREVLVGRHLPLARRLALRYVRGSEPLDDLVQVASVGLLKAVDRFEPERGSPFAAFAAPTILGELKRHFRDTRWAVRVPRELQERTLKIDRAIDELTVRLGRTPSPRDVALATGLDVEEVLEAQVAVTGIDADSLDAPAGGEDGAAPISELMGGDDPAYELVEDGMAVAPALRSLSERDRVILRLRFVEDLTQKEVGQRLGISQMQVSRLLRRALHRLREATGAAELVA